MLQASATKTKLKWEKEFQIRLNIFFKSYFDFYFKYNGEYDIKNIFFCLDKINVYAVVKIGL